MQHTDLFIEPTASTRLSASVFLEKKKAHWFGLGRSSSIPRRLSLVLGFPGAPRPHLLAAGAPRETLVPFLTVTGCGPRRAALRSPH